ncbi:GNAT family N-acetyltransferase [Aeromonas simiae]|nr:GNAT family N-acetyltransferase [Aeromonas simiae]MDO2947054.1 GNAT family N-acetyltransferase [Aeromonas simiae]MDO2950666.1 GNAT family N-acetyltransferase [Aeromonas simiae]MDO2954352.1 GNAT family N-acetyltransferase [Aeromonas simiae]
MIRLGVEKDMDAVLEIWLLASLQSHDFVNASSWWQVQEDLRVRYLEQSTIWVCEERGELLGFMALADDYLAALFVRPDRQGRGVGHALLTKAKGLLSELRAKVYVENDEAVRFYRHHGFVIEGEELDPMTGHSLYLIRYAGQTPAAQSA